MSGLPEWVSLTQQPDGTWDVYCTRCEQGVTGVRLVRVNPRDVRVVAWVNRHLHDENKA